MKYVAFYDTSLNLDEDRLCVLAAVNKINYIVDKITSLGYHVEIISPSWTKNKKGFYFGKEYKLSNKSTLKLFSTFGATSKIGKGLRYIWSILMLTLYIIFNIKYKETVIVYHSVSLYIPIIVMKYLKKANIILEVEEIYADVVKNLRYEKIEYKIFKKVDAFIFPTELLNDKLNEVSKPSAIAYGTYKVEDNRNQIFDDGKIHVVYAGTFDPRKGGAIAAVGAAEYLDDNYHVHIIGFGSEDQKEFLKDRIRDISKKTRCKVTYDGLYRDEEYITFLQKCHIGLSTQTPNGKYNETSFPSKVLSYMSNGLRVVSIKIKVLEKSEIRDLLYYYEKDSSKEIANAIKKVDLSDKYNSREKIIDLDRKFMKDIKKLMEKVDEQHINKNKR